MFLKTKRPDPEQGILERRLELLDESNNGPSWFYLTSELSNYNIQRIKLVNKIQELDESWIPPEKPT